MPFFSYLEEFIAAARRQMSPPPMGLGEGSLRFTAEVQSVHGAAESRMNCPTCHAGKTFVIRTVTRERAVARQRECQRCSWRWETVEFPREDFERMTLALDLANKLQRLAPGAWPELPDS
jgi:hypothetical protein